MQPWKPRGKKAERGRRSAPLLSLLQIRFLLKEQRHPATCLVPNKHTCSGFFFPFFFLNTRGIRDKYVFSALICIVRADEGDIKALYFPHHCKTQLYAAFSYDGSHLSSHGPAESSVSTARACCMTATRGLCCSDGG